MRGCSRETQIGHHAMLMTDFDYPKSVISVMMITTSVFEKMCSRFEGAMGFHCNRETGRQMPKKKFVCA